MIVHHLTNLQKRVWKCLITQFKHVKNVQSFGGTLQNWDTLYVGDVEVFEAFFVVLKHFGELFQCATEHLDLEDK